MELDLKRLSLDSIEDAIKHNGSIVFKAVMSLGIPEDINSRPFGYSFDIRMSKDRTTYEVYVVAEK